MRDRGGFPRAPLVALATFTAAGGDGSRRWQLGQATMRSQMNLGCRRRKPPVLRTRRHPRFLNVLLSSRDVRRHAFRHGLTRAQRVCRGASIWW